MRYVTIIIGACWIFVCPRYLQATPKDRPFTVKDSIQVTQAIYPYGHDPVLISPNGERYLVVLQRADLARNGSWVELLSGGTGSLGAAAETEIVARLFSKSTATAGDLITGVRWLPDSEHIAFLWDDGERPRRVVSVGTRDHQIVTLATHSTAIEEYDIGLDRRTIVFTARRPLDSHHEKSSGLTGFAVDDQSILSILEGHGDDSNADTHYDTFVSYAPQRLLHKVRELDRVWSTTPELLRLSPDGRYAVAVGPAGPVPEDWNEYTNHLFKDAYLPAARQHPDSPNLIRQYFIIDIKRGTSHPLWNAPENPSGKVLWSPDGKSVVIGPTFEPVLRADRAGLSGQALAEVDVKTGNFTAVPLDESVVGSKKYDVAWSKNGILEIALVASKGVAVVSRFKKTEGQWTATADPEGVQSPLPGVRVELREDPNTRPKLYAVDEKTGTDRLIKDLNPWLEYYALGRVELVHWPGTDGRLWSGLLYYPVHFLPGRPFPLVIQTHGYSATKFSLDGPFPTVFAAQALANRDIAVLQLGAPDGSMSDIVATPKEPEVYMAGFEGAIKQFVAMGIADSKKIGVIGFSRTGWAVEYLLTHSQYEIAAAEVADNMDGSYFQYITSDIAARAEYEADNGAQPFGEGLEVWLRSAPGFRADRVHAPLRLEIDTGPVDSVLSEWEMFSNLRYLRKPVELFVIPNIQRGVHILQNPSQRLASQGGTVDWFCFWLSNQEDAVATKKAQYARWRALKKLQK